MACRWTVRGDRPASHDTDCVCPACWTRLETAADAPNNRVVVAARFRHVQTLPDGTLQVVTVSGWNGDEPPWPESMPTAPLARWCSLHGDTLGDCEVCGPPWTPDGVA